MAFPLNGSNGFEGAVRLIHPTVVVLRRDNPDIEMEIWTSQVEDCIMVGTVNRAMNSDNVHVSALLTRSELERGNWFQTVGGRLGLAVSAVLPNSIDHLGEEYDEIMQAQEVMGQLKP